MRAGAEVMASSSPQVPHWILSSLGELCTQWPNKCDRHLPGLKPPHSKWRAPSHPQLTYRRYVTAPHISLPFPPSRETRGCARWKPCVSYRQLEQVGGGTSHPRGESESGEVAGWLEGQAGTCHLYKRAFHSEPRINSSFWNLFFFFFAPKFNPRELAHQDFQKSNCRRKETLKGEGSLHSLHQSPPPKRLLCMRGGSSLKLETDTFVMTEWK